MRPGVFPMIPK